VLPRARWIPCLSCRFLEAPLTINQLIVAQGYPRTAGGCKSNAILVNQSVTRIDAGDCKNSRLIRYLKTKAKVSSIFPYSRPRREVASRSAGELASPRDQGAAVADSAGTLLATGAGGLVALAAYLAAVDSLPSAGHCNGRGIRPAAIHHPSTEPAPRRPWLRLGP